MRVCDVFLMFLVCVYAHIFVAVWLTVASGRNLYQKSNSDQSFLIAAQFVGLIVKWQTGRQSDKATGAHAKAMSLDNLEYFTWRAPFLTR